MHLHTTRLPSLEAWTVWTSESTGRPFSDFGRHEGNRGPITFCRIDAEIRADSPETKGIRKGVDIIVAWICDWEGTVFA